MKHFDIYAKAPVAANKAPAITVADLIPTGRENAVKRADLLNACIIHNLAYTDRNMRKQIEAARRDYVILNLSDGEGYYRPTPAELRDLQKYIRQEEARAKAAFTNIKLARKLYEDFKNGRITE